jgi:predicted MFS family arabinose efflux permease
MMMPFGSAFAVNNLGISMTDLPLLYLITGVCSMISAPQLGRLSDSWGKFKAFSLASVLMIVVVVVYCNLGLTPLWMVIGFSILMFIGVSARMVSSSALLSAVPTSTNRGAFMSINASVQMVSGGIASLAAGSIVYQTSTGVLVNYDLLGYVVAAATLVIFRML